MKGEHDVNKRVELGGIPFPFPFPFQLLVLLGLCPELLNTK